MNADDHSDEELLSRALHDEADQVQADRVGAV